MVLTLPYHGSMIRRSRRVVPEAASTFPGGSVWDCAVDDKCARCSLAGLVAAACHAGCSRAPRCAQANSMRPRLVIGSHRDGRAHPSAPGAKSMLDPIHYIGVA